MSQSLQLHLLEQDTTNDITVVRLKAKHQEFMNANKKLDKDVITLMEILGGADVILQHYLSINNLSSLTPSQLKSIDNLLSSTHHFEIKPGHIKSPELILSTSNSYLHSIFNHPQLT